MLHLTSILDEVTEDSWKSIGWGFENSTVWKAVYWGLQVLKERDAAAEALKDNVNGTGKDVSDSTDGDGAYETEEDVSPYVYTPACEKFHRACYILNWMDRQEEFHVYSKDGEQKLRRRPDVTEIVEKSLLQPFSKAETRELELHLGKKFAEAWAKQAEKERTATFELYGEELIALIKDQRESMIPEMVHKLDWNWSEFAEDVAKTLVAKVADKMESLPERFGYTTPWVRTACYYLKRIEDVCAVN